MNELINISGVGIELSTKENKVFTSSKQIAKIFGKNHKNVLKIIEDKLHLFNHLNFEVVEYKDRKGEKRKSYDLDRDFTTFIIMGFTGKKADKFKLAFIDAFNQMEEMLFQKNQKAINERIKLKNMEIERLKNERKLCMLTPDGFTSIRGVAQRSGYSEKDIRTMLVDMGGIANKVRKTLYWHVEKDLEGLIQQKSEHSTPYVDYERMIELLDTYYQ